MTVPRPILVSLFAGKRFKSRATTSDEALQTEHVSPVLVVSVVRGPFRPAPRALLHCELTLTPGPPWFLGNRTAQITARPLTALAAASRLRALPGILASALRG